MAASHVFNPALWPPFSTSASFAKAYTSAVSDGDVLWCFTWQNNATNTCSGVTDSLNGTAWTQAFGPIRGDSNNSNASLYAFYKTGSGAGTPTVTATWSASAQGMIVIGAITGLSGGGAFDQSVSGKVVAPSVGYQLTSAALAQSGEAAVGMVLANTGPTTPLWTGAGNVDTVNFERVQVHITTSASAQTFGTTGATSGTASMGAMFFKDGGASMTGAITLDAFTLAGVFGSAPSSSLLGNLTLDDFVLSGTLGLTPGRIDTQPFKNWSGTLLPGITIPKLTFLRLSDMAPALTLTNQTTAGDGVLTVQNAALIPGVDYIVVAANADGTALGAELYRAT